MWSYITHFNIRIARICLSTCSGPSHRPQDNTLHDGRGQIINTIAFHDAIGLQESLSAAVHRQLHQIQRLYCPPTHTTPRISLSIEASNCNMKSYNILFWDKVHEQVFPHSPMCILTVEALISIIQLHSVMAERMFSTQSKQYSVA